MFDQRLAAKVIRTVDVSYGGENGFNQAIELVQDDLSNVKFVQEKKLICNSILFEIQLNSFQANTSTKSAEIQASTASLSPIQYQHWSRVPSRL
jgi:peptide subunit release factor 1 (eRF1)